MSFRLGEILNLEPVPEFTLYGFTVRRSASPADLEEICKFRYQVFDNEGYLDRTKFPTPIMTDEFDAKAEQIVAYDRAGEIAGTMRVVFDLIGPPPTQRLFNIQIAHLLKEGTIDIGKFAIAPSYRSRPGRILVPIFKAAIEATIVHRASYILAFFPDRLADGYRKLGCDSVPAHQLPLSPAATASRSAMQPYFDQQAPKPRFFPMRRVFKTLNRELPPHLQGRRDHRPPFPARRAAPATP